MLRVKILCTIGPASRDLDVLEALIRSGMNVARLNLSHGTHEYHAETIHRVRTLSDKLGKPIAILADLQGPKLRMGKMQPSLSRPRQFRRRTARVRRGNRAR